MRACSSLDHHRFMSMHACDYSAERLNLHNPLLTVNPCTKKTPYTTGWVTQKIIGWR